MHKFSFAHNNWYRAYYKLLFCLIAFKYDEGKMYKYLSKTVQFAEVYLDHICR